MNTPLKPYRVTGDHNRLVYSAHSSEDAAARAAKALAYKWGPSLPGSEPRVERSTDAGWVDVIGYITADRPERAL